MAAGATESFHLGPEAGDREQWGWQSSSETSKPAARVTPIPTRPYLPPSNFPRIVPFAAD